MYMPTAKQQREKNERTARIIAQERRIRARQEELAREQAEFKARRAA